METTIAKRGMPTLFDRVESEMNQNLYEILKSFTDVDSAEEAAKRIATISNGKITPTGPTVLRAVVRGIDSDDLSLTDNCANWIRKAQEKHNHKGPKSIKDILEEQFKMPFWQVVETQMGMANDLEEACNILNTITNGKTKTKKYALKKIIEKGIESKEITEKDSCTKWVGKKNKNNKKGRRTQEEIERDEIKEEQKKAKELLGKVPLILTCNKCGTQTRVALDNVTGDYLALFLGARRCKCEKWGDFSAVGTYKDQKFYKNWTEKLGEHFTDANGKKITNPFMPSK
jgi:hypothetical protein